MSAIKPGWTALTDTLSDFHRVLVNLFSHYASIAVQQMQLPEDIFALSPEEREKLRGISTLRTCGPSDTEPTKVTVSCSQATLFRGEKLTTMEVPEVVVESGTFVGLVPDEVAKQAAGYYSSNATSIPPVVYKQRLLASRDRSIEINDGYDENGLSRSFCGKKGTIGFFSVMPKFIFRTCRFQMTDSLGGKGTRIVAVGVGGKVQKFDKANLVRKPNGFHDPVLTREFVQKIGEAYGEHGGKDGRYPMDTCQQSLIVWFHIEFLEDCEWFATLHGKACC